MCAEVSKTDAKQEHDAHDIPFNLQRISACLTLHFFFFLKLCVHVCCFLHFSNESTVESCMQGECINYTEAGDKYCFDINSKVVYDTLDIPVRDPLVKLMTLNM